MKKKFATVSLLSALLIGNQSYSTEVQNKDSSDHQVSSNENDSHNDETGEWKPTGTGKGQFIKNLGQKTSIKSYQSTPIMSYHGGSVMSGTPTVYYIWYGDWNSTSTNANPGAKPILEQLISDLNRSTYYNINTSYKASNAPIITNTVAFGKSIDVGYATDISPALTNPKSLNLNDLTNIVSYALLKNPTIVDSNAIYFVLTSKDVTFNDPSNLGGSFCNNFCGFHTYGSLSNSTVIKYAFVGNPDACATITPTNPTACEYQLKNSPNNNPAADGIASVLTHELVETVTDPTLSAWYDSKGYENADKCAWNFGYIFTGSSNSSTYKYNLTLGGHQYLIQQNWLYKGTNSNGSCALSL